jgi:hypothetical protein
MERDDRYETDVPWVEDDPVPRVSPKILSERQIIANEKPDSPKVVPTSHLCPPVEIFIIGFFSGPLISGNNGIDL